MPDDYVKDHVIIYTRYLRLHGIPYSGYTFHILRNINLQNLKRASAFIDIMDRHVDQVRERLLYLN